MRHGSGDGPINLEKVERSEEWPDIPEGENGVKYDQGKSRYDLIDAYALEMLAQVYTYGTIKYDDHNWRGGFRWGRIFGALMRHAWAFWRGEENDPESGLPHMAHAAWQCFALLSFSKEKLGEDDRWKDLK